MYDFSGSSYDSHSFGNSSHDIDNKLRYSWSNGSSSPPSDLIHDDPFHAIPHPSILSNHGHGQGHDFGSHNAYGSTYHSNAPRTHKRDNLTRHSSMKDSLYKSSQATRSNLSSQRSQYNNRSSHKHSSSLPYHLQLSPYTKISESDTPRPVNLQVPTSPQDTNTPAIQTNPGVTNDHSITTVPRITPKPTRTPRTFRESNLSTTSTSARRSPPPRRYSAYPYPYRPKSTYFSPFAKRTPSPEKFRLSYFKKNEVLHKPKGKKWEVDPEPDDEAEQEKIRKKEGGKQSLLSKILNFLKS